MSIFLQREDDFLVLVNKKQADDQVLIFLFILAFLF